MTAASDYRRCPECDEFAWFYAADAKPRHSVHVCPPLWLVAFVCETGDVPDDDDYRQVYARHPDDAAEKAAEEYDSNGEYDILRGGEHFAWVKPATGGDVKKFAVSGESVPQYSATEVP